MKCKKVRKMMSKYFDNQADIQQKELILEHIKICESCKKEFEIFKKIYEFMPEYEKNIEVSSNFNNKVFERIYEKKGKSIFENIPIFNLNWRVALAFSVIFVIFLSSIFMNPCKNKVVGYNSYSYELYPEEEVDLAMMDLYSNFEDL